MFPVSRAQPGCSQYSQTKEGTTRAAAMLAEKLGVETPIISTLYNVLYRGLSVSAATQYLLDRPLRGE